MFSWWSWIKLSVAKEESVEPSETMTVETPSTVAFTSVLSERQTIDSMIKPTIFFLLCSWLYINIYRGKKEAFDT
jgi:hypothetical protein